MVKGTVVIDVDRCKGCALCTAVCPRGVLRMGRDRFNVRGYRAVELADPEGSCTGCALCALVCPDVVFTVCRHPIKRTV